MAENESHQLTGAEAARDLAVAWFVERELVGFLTTIGITRDRSGRVGLFIGLREALPAGEELPTTFGDTPVLQIEVTGEATLA